MYLYFSRITVCFVENRKARLEGYYNNLSKRGDYLHQLCTNGRGESFWNLDLLMDPTG